MSTHIITVSIQLENLIKNLPRSRTPDKDSLLGIKSKYENKKAKSELIVNRNIDQSALLEEEKQESLLDKIKASHDFQPQKLIIEVSDSS